MKDQHLGLRSRILAVVLVGAMVLGLGFSRLSEQGNANSASEVPATSGVTAVILNWYAASDPVDGNANQGRLVDGAVFIAAAMPCPLSARPPCFDQASVVDELIRAGAELNDQYALTDLEQVGGYVTGRIDVLPR